MTATGHALVGALLAAKFHNPYLVIPLSFASHFACDALPHWDSGTHWRKKSKTRLIEEAAFDVALSIIASYLLYHTFLGQNDYLLLYASVFAAQLPDWIAAPYFFFGVHEPISTGVGRIQTILNTKLDKPWGIVTQIMTVIGLYLFLFKFPI